MSEAAALFPLVRPPYPERADRPPESRLDEWGERVAGTVRRALRARRALQPGFVAAVRARERELAGLDAAGLRAAAADAGKLLRRDGFRPDRVAEAFAVVAETSARVLGKRHFDVQLQGGWVLLQGMVAEMETGEGKTLTATLPACAAALAGVPVHVFTVNDYLVTRDAGITRPLYEALGLTLGVVTEDQSPPERQAAYACQVVYGTNKTIVFDYLRDRITLGSRNSPLRLRLERLGGRDAKAKKLLLRGLGFAIVDEADSVLVDEARTPLIISAPAGEGDEERVAHEGIRVGRALEAGADFELDLRQRRVTLTDAGRERVERLCAPLGGPWAGRLRREEMATQALSALHLFVRDEHYLVREGKVEIVDEYTGRTMADRSWEKGLHQLVEAKEGCEVTAPKEPLSRISYQRFFRRYLLLSGMTGTGAEVAGELGAVYGLAIVRIPTHRPSRRVVLPERVFATEREKWAAIVERVRDLQARGCAVLVGTRSVAASEVASRLLAEAGLAHRVLNAKQDKEEADIVAEAGGAGRITIATNMAGRGTDIALGEGVAARGGLHVILSERHDTERIDRQLAGRCARQGDPGVFEPILSVEDAILELAGRPVRAAAIAAMAALGPARGARAGSLAIRFAQRRAQRAHSRVRRALLRSDQQMGRTLAFSGSPE